LHGAGMLSICHGSLWEGFALTLILRRSHTGTVWFYTSTSNKRAAQTVHKVINKGLKTYVQSLHTGENFH